MIIVEALFLTVLLATLAAASYTDCCENRIPNQLLAISGGLAALLDVIYYLFFASRYCTVFLANLLVLILISFFFYAYHLWAAGDSKLLIVVALSIPGRLYTFWDASMVSGFAILIFVFSAAFLYVMAETVVMGIRNRNLFRLKTRKIDFARVLLSYLSMVGVVTVVHWALYRLFARPLGDDRVLSLTISFFIVLTVSQIRNRLSNRSFLLIASFCWCVVIALFAFGQYTWRSTIDYRPWLFVCILMFARAIAEKYNYQTIPTQEVKRGHILSAATVLAFRPSKVQGLPVGTTEDLRSRLTEQEAESVRRWEKSKYGKPYIMVVRKIPFALFIGIGTVAFLVLEVAMA